LDKVRHSKGNKKPAEIRTAMQKVMQNNAAVFRTGDVLKEVTRLSFVGVELNVVGVGCEID